MSVKPEPEADSHEDQGRVDGAPVAPDAGVQGEGDYEAARRFQWKEREFVQDGSQVEKAAREAADALDGPEAEELEQARRETGAGKTS